MTMVASAAKVLGEQELRRGVMNPVTRLWRKLVGNPLIRTKMGEWLKLAKIAIVIVIGSVEDERTFSNLSFIKSKLATPRLNCTICMYTHKKFHFAGVSLSRCY